VVIHVSAAHTSLARAPRRVAVLLAVGVVLMAVAGIFAGATGATGATGTTTAATGAADRGNWTAGWTASPVVGTVIPFSPDCPAGTGLTDETVRDVVFLSAGGDAVRVRLTNAFGAQRMRVTHASVAVQAANAAAVPGSVRALSFGGAPAITIAAGAEALSDPVPLRVAPLSTLLVSVYVPGPTGPVTNHPFTAQGNFLAGGDRSQQDAADGFGSIPCWMFVDGVDVRTPRRVMGSVVALGDSITDTANTTGNANRRWPDDLARRLSAVPGRTLSVANAGLGGNRLLAPREGEPWYGVPALARLDRDVLAQTGVRDVILMEGVNDIGFDATADDIISAYQQIAARTRARGLRVFAGTITPFGGSFVQSDARIKTWETVNAWIRAGHGFDGVIDFAASVSDPADPLALAPAYDSGDHLHPNDAGCQAMADAVDLAALIG
jgi:lysophospholipase L1-like esterase